jgi:hypothetical protein
MGGADTPPKEEKGSDADGAAGGGAPYEKGSDGGGAPYMDDGGSEGGAPYMDMLGGSIIVGGGGGAP